MKFYVYRMCVCVCFDIIVKNQHEQLDVNTRMLIYCRAHDTYILGFSRFLAVVSGNLSVSPSQYP